jgi:hypothetical protein
MHKIQMDKASPKNVTGLPSWSSSEKQAVSSSAFRTAVKMPTTRSIIDLPSSFQLFQRGVFISAEISVKNGEDRISNCWLTLKVRLDLKDSTGKPFIAYRKYNYAETGKGRSSIVRDYQDWIGKQLTLNELWAFDPKKFTMGRKVVVELEVRRRGSHFEFWIKSFHPRTLLNLATAGK